MSFITSFDSNADAGDWAAKIKEKIDQEKINQEKIKKIDDELKKYQDAKALEEYKIVKDYHKKLSKGFLVPTPKLGDHIDKHEDLMGATTYKYLWETKSVYDPDKLDIKVWGDSLTGSMTASFNIPDIGSLGLTLVEQAHWIQELKGDEQWGLVVHLMKKIENWVANSKNWNEDQLVAYLLLVKIYKEHTHK